MAIEILHTWAAVLLASGVVVATAALPVASVRDSVAVAVASDAVDAAAVVALADAVEFAVVVAFVAFAATGTASRPQPVAAAVTLFP